MSHGNKGVRQIWFLFISLQHYRPLFLDLNILFKRHFLFRIIIRIFNAFYAFTLYLVVKYLIKDFKHSLRLYKDPSNHSIHFLQTSGLDIMFKSKRSTTSLVLPLIKIIKLYKKSRAINLLTRKVCIRERTTTSARDFVFTKSYK